MFAARLAEESRSDTADRPRPRIVMVPQKPTSTDITDTVFDPRLREYSPFDGLLNAPTPTDRGTVAVPRHMNQRAGRTSSIAQLALAQIRREIPALLAAPLTAPVWWWLWKACDALWATK